MKIFWFLFHPFIFSSLFSIKFPILSPALKPPSFFFILSKWKILSHKSESSIYEATPEVATCGKWGRGRPIIWHVDDFITIKMIRLLLHLHPGLEIKHFHLDRILKSDYCLKKSYANCKMVASSREKTRGRKTLLDLQIRSSSYRYRNVWQPPFSTVGTAGRKGCTAKSSSVETGFPVGAVGRLVLPAEKVISMAFTPKDRYFFLILRRWSYLPG